MSIYRVRKLHAYDQGPHASLTYGQSSRKWPEGPVKISCCRLLPAAYHPPRVASTAGRKAFISSRIPIFYHEFKRHPRHSAFASSSLTTSSDPFNRTILPSSCHDLHTRRYFMFTFHLRSGSIPYSIILTRSPLPRALRPVNLSSVLSLMAYTYAFYDQALGQAKSIAITVSLALQVSTGNVSLHRW